MVVYVDEAGSGRIELTEALLREGIPYQECPTEAVRELGPASWRIMEVKANLPEVVPIPPEYAQGDGDVKAWRLPSGRLIISNSQGNLEQITSPRLYFNSNPSIRFLSSGGTSR